MEISKLSSSKEVSQKASITSKKLDKGFSEEFNSAAKREKEKQIGKLLDSIKKKGKQIIETRSLSSVHEYKDQIKEYLSMVLEDAFRVEKVRSMYGGNPSTLVQVINDELNKLAQTVLVQEKGTIEVVNMIENIEGLLVDIYQ